MNWHMGGERIKSHDVKARDCIKKERIDGEVKSLMTLIERVIQF